jgi:hypothetical protein
VSHCLGWSACLTYLGSSDDCGCSVCVGNQQIDLDKERNEGDSDDEDPPETASAVIAATGEAANLELSKTDVKPTTLETKHNEAKSDILDKELCLLPATHYGFSFKLREWGQLVSPIT